MVVIAATSQEEAAEWLLPVMSLSLSLDIPMDENLLMDFIQKKL